MQIAGLDKVCNRELDVDTSKIRGDDDPQFAAWIIEQEEEFIKDMVTVNVGWKNG
jgi:hypothetical protein